jgi:beta-glucosidase
VEASVEIPRWQLAGTRRIHLKPGQRKQVDFKITPAQMSLIDNEGRRILEPGFFNVYVSGSQPDERSQKLTGCNIQKETFEVEGCTTQLEY